jgi:hypothetical protein
MKKLFLTTLIMAVICALAGTPAYAAKGKKKKNQPEPSAAASFDANKDGTLDKDELATFEKDAEMIKKFDKNADGKLDDAEKAAAQESLKTAEPVKTKKELKKEKKKKKNT